MEKVIWVRSSEKRVGTQDHDGLEVVNKYLEEGWKVKLISACAAGDAWSMGQAYIVIEKEDE